MGQSTNATLAFGRDIGEELPEILQDPDDGCLGNVQKALGSLSELISVETHCSGDYPMYFLAVKSSITTARRGYPEKLNFKQISHTQISRDSVLRISVEEEQALMEACAKLGLDYSNVGWHIFSYWI